MTFRQKYKLRKLQKNNKSGDVIGTTLPKDLVLNNKPLSQLLGVNFFIYTSGTAIILESGCVDIGLNDKELKLIVKSETKVKL